MKSCITNLCRNALAVAAILLAGRTTIAAGGPDRITIKVDQPGIKVSPMLYWGIPTYPNAQYRASFYAKAVEGFTGPVTVSLESNDGITTFATASVPAITGTWQRYTTTLSTKQLTSSTSNRLVISAGSKGTVYLNLVSLFPPTYSNRPNGNRIDIMQKLGAMKPAFPRLPGGDDSSIHGIR